MNIQTSLTLTCYTGDAKRCSLSASRNKEGNRESYVMVDSAGESVRNSRPRNEIVFKPNVQPDVFSQVAKQSGQVPKP